MVNKSLKGSTWMQSQNDRMISVRFQGKPFNITVIQVYAQTSNAEEPEVEWFYEDLQDLLKPTPRKDVLFIIGDQNAKVESQETPGVTGKFGLEVQNEAGQRLIEFCQENTLVIANTLFQHVFSIPKFRPLETFRTEVWLFPCVNMIKNSLNSACLLLLVV